MLNSDRQRELDRLLDGDLSDEERARIVVSLEADPEAIDWLAERALMHANLRRAMQRRAIGAEAQRSGREKGATVSFSRPRKRRMLMAMAAALAVLLTLAFWLSYPKDETFATMTETRATFWESGDLPTSDGSRLGQGTLRLAEGLATLKFDSGAEVILEAPATLILVDAMKCELVRGTAVSDIPDSALGFRIKTPSADVVDYGTRFAVSVYEGTGETHTQVIEGRVQVEYDQSDKIVELKTGQRNTVVGEIIGAAQDGTDQEYRTLPVEPVEHSEDWTLLESVKDAYTGRVAGHESEVLLYLKKGIRDNSPHRMAYLGFDLRGIDQKRIEEAELLLYFAPTGWGLASHVPDATFSVYGFVGDVPVWDGLILHGQFPDTTEAEYLGSFTIAQGVQKGRFRVRSDELTAFLQKHPSSEITLKVVRDTREDEDGGLVHGFASRRHPILPAPTLAIRETKETPPN